MVLRLRVLGGLRPPYFFRFYLLFTYIGMKKKPAIVPKIPIQSPNSVPKVIHMDRYTCNVFLRKDAKRKDGTCPLILDVHINGLRHKAPLYIYVTEDLFNEDERLINPSHPEANDYNMMIRDAVSKANDIFKRYRLQEEELTTYLFAREYNLPKIARKSFTEYYKATYDYRKKKKLAEYNTLRNENNTYNKLVDFRKKIFFAEIDNKFFDEFNVFLKTNKKYKNGQNTRWNAFKHINSYLNRAVDEKILKENPYKKWSGISQVEGEIVALTQDELIKLIKAYIDLREEKKNNLVKVLKYFLFMCFTGLRISDTNSVYKTNVIGDTITFIPHKTRNKNEKLLTVPLNEPAKWLIQSSEESGGDALFDTFADQTTNRHLKTIAKKAGVNPKLSCHMGRHTFGTLHMELGGTVEVLQKLFGHSSVKYTMKYVHVSNKRKEEQIANFNIFKIEDAPDS